METTSFLLRRLKQLVATVAVLILFIPTITGAFADLIDDLKDSMKARQQEISATYNSVSIRVTTMNPRDERKSEAKALLDEAKDLVDDFKDIDVGANVVGDPPVPSAEYNEAEEAAVDAINAVNRYLISPARPGNVPEGDIIEDFIPRVIRLLFQFAWVAILITIVVSGVMMVISFDNEERVTKAKTMLLWAIVGFAFITLAFALVRGITGITFF